VKCRGARGRSRPAVVIKMKAASLFDIVLTTPPWPTRFATGLSPRRLAQLTVRMDWDGDEEALYRRMLLSELGELNGHAKSLETTAVWVIFLLIAIIVLLFDAGEVGSVLKAS
jgi:hypothetical protein